MTPGCPKIDPRVRRTRQMLFRAFGELLGEKPFDQISVQDVAERSTLNRATFYDHFVDKFALLEAMIGERFGAMFAARMEGIEATCETSLRQVILTACDFMSGLSLPCQKQQQQPFEAIVESCVRTVIYEAILAGLKGHGENEPELKATMASWTITGAAIRWNRDPRLSADKLADVVLPTVRAALEACD